MITMKNLAFIILLGILLNSCNQCKEQILYYKSGAKYKEGIFCNGVINGYYKEYFENGKIMTSGVVLQFYISN